MPGIDSLEKIHQDCRIIIGKRVSKRSRDRNISSEYYFTLDVY